VTGREIVAVERIVATTTLVNRDMQCVSGGPATTFTISCRFVIDLFES
jgi:hypothetical protein